MNKRVTLLIEFPTEPPDVLAIIETLWTVLYRAVNWGVNQIIIGPVKLYDRFTVERLFLFEAADLTYTTDKPLWALLAGGVPVNANKALWLLDLGSTQDELLFAVDDFNEKTHSSHAIRSIRVYAHLTE